MNHQPYETWILEAGERSRTEQVELQKHLASCTECNNLALALTMVEKDIKAVPPLDPAPGFTARWLASLPQRAKADEREHVRNWLLGLGASAFASLAAFLALISLTDSPINLLVNGFQSMIRLFTLIRHGIAYLLNLITTLSPTVLVVGGIMLSSWVLLAGLAWVLSFRYASKQGVTQL